MKPELASPDSIGDFIENLRKGYSGKSLVVTLNSTDEGVALRGRLVPSLPASVMATLRSGSNSRRGEVQSACIARSTTSTGWCKANKS